MADRGGHPALLNRPSVSAEPGIGEHRSLSRFTAGGRRLRTTRNSCCVQNRATPAVYNTRTA
eukprot:11041566-Alexandrium_andersonii.AAC.1